MYGDLDATLMIFGLVTFAKVNLHPPSSVMRSAIYRAMTRLNFVPDVGKLGGNMWLRGVDQLTLWIFYNEKSNSSTFNLTCNHFKDITQSILALNLVFIGTWPM